MRIRMRACPVDLCVSACARRRYGLNSKKVNIAFVSIGVDYFQVISMFANSHVTWPEAIKQLFYILSVFNFNLEIMAPGAR